MARLTITLPDEIAGKLAKKRNKSGFIAIALKEKLEQEEKERIRNLLLEGYKATSEEDAKLQSDWEMTGIEEWD